MSLEHLEKQAHDMLRFLCEQLDSRRVGSPGNQRAAAWAADQLAAAGFALERQPFDCIDWQTEGADLTIDGQSFPVESSPYSLGCAVTGELAAADSLEALSGQDLTGKILLMHGALTALNSHSCFR